MKYPEAPLIVILAAAAAFTILMDVSNPHAVHFQKTDHECAPTITLARMHACMPLKNLRFYWMYVSPTGTAPMPLFINTDEHFTLSVSINCACQISLCTCGYSLISRILSCVVCVCVQFLHGQSVLLHRFMESL